MVSTPDALFFSNLAYHGADPTGVWFNQQLAVFGYDKEGWEYLSQSAPDAHSYFGVAFENRGTREIVIANRGSGSVIDWGQTDWDIFHHNPDIPAFADALAFVDSVAASNPGFADVVTGHSLGGAEAQYQAAERGLAGTVFAAPGMAWLVPGQTAAVTDYVFVGDPIGNLDTPVGSRTVIYPDGPIQFFSAAQSVAVDAQLAAAGHATLASALQLIGLHFIVNDLEHFGLTEEGVGPVPYPGAINPVVGAALALFLPAPLGGVPSLADAQSGPEPAAAPEDSAAQSLSLPQPEAPSRDPGEHPAPSLRSLFVAAAREPTDAIVLSFPAHARNATRSAPARFDFASCVGPDPLRLDGVSPGLAAHQQAL